MPEYTYECQECEFQFTVEQKMTARTLRKCPECGKVALERVILSAPYAFVRQDPTTVGQLAERNTKKMGREAVEMTERNRAARDDEVRRQNRESLQKRLPKGYELLGSSKDAADPNARPPEKVQEAVKSGNQKAVDNYILTGES